jgi:hypothetical protein
LPILSPPYRYLKRLKGHSSFITHLDWSRDNRIIQSTCGARELLYWDVAAGTQMLSSSDCVEGDTEWATQSVDLGFGVMGIWQSNQDGSDINTVDVADAAAIPPAVSEARGPFKDVAKGSLVATGDDGGCLSVYHYPCVVKHAPGREGRAHSSHVLSCKWLNSIGNSAVIATAGGNDCAAMVWMVSPLS